MAAFSRLELEALARRAYAGLESGDLVSSVVFFASGFRWHVPGESAVSATYEGAEEYFGERLNRMSPLEEWKLRIRRVLANEPASAALVELDLTASRLGRHVEMVCFHQLRFDADGRIVEATGFVEDPEALDRFFGPPGLG